MLLSLAWLREFTPFEGGIEELSERLTMLGLEVEGLIRPFPDLDQVVVGRVLECRKHPDADRLSVCNVEVGREAPLNIVCGAPNVAAGQYVLTALPGSCLPGGRHIRAAKVRGEFSEGMICAEDELGLGEGHQGILILDGAPRPGLEIKKLWPELDDLVLDVNITPNRSDCLSVRGLAREIAMAFGLPLTVPDRFADMAESGPAASELMAIELPRPDLCPVYRGRIVDNIQSRESPWPLKLRLRAAGQRPLSAVVDVTNYIMFELGQPLHAFDLDSLEGGLIRVRPSGEEMDFVTLDGQKRKLLPDDLLICDAVKPVALAGVMGGENTEFRPDSKRLFLESAVFRPASIRKTARRLGLGSEASYRFERGVDQQASLMAMDKAARMIAALCGGRLLPGRAEDEPRPWRSAGMIFRPERARACLALPLKEDFCASALSVLGCSLERSSPDKWLVTAPSHRLDLEREIDLIEEVGRVYGLDRIPIHLPKVAKSLERAGGTESEYAFVRRIRNWAIGAGLHEAINFSFVGQDELDALDQPLDIRVAVRNPLSEEQAVLRTVLAPGLLRNVRQNMSHSNPRLALFETAHVFKASACSETTVEEWPRLGLLLHGPRCPERWPWKKQDQQDYGYSDLRGLIEHLLAVLRFDSREIAFELSSGRAWLSPGVDIFINGRLVGFLGRLRPDLAECCQARREVWLAEVELDQLRGLCAFRQTVFRPLPKFPAVRRDMTVAARPGLQAQSIMAVLREMKRPLLEEIALVDIYEPEGGQDRHITLRLVFRHLERTLTDREVDQEREKAAEMLVRTLGVKI